MRQAEPTPPLPIAFSPAGEAHRWLERYKTSRMPKWRLTNAKSLWEMCDLCCYLYALGRVDEAIAIASYPAEHGVFKGDYNLWDPIATAISLRYHLLHTLGRREEARLAITPFADPPKRPSKRLDYALISLTNCERLLNQLAKEDIPPADALLKGVTVVRGAVNSYCCCHAGFPGTEEFPCERFGQLIEEGIGVVRKLLLEKRGK